MPDLTIEIVDAFAEGPFRGNAAAVVREADDLTDAQMQAIAREMNLAETSFLTPRRRNEWNLRWMTPTREVTLCGHATLAAAHALRDAGAWDSPRAAFQTLSGRLTVEISETETGALYWLTLPNPTLTPYESDRREVLRAFALRESDLHKDLSWRLTPERDLLIPAAGLTVIQNLVPDSSRLIRLSEAEQLRGFCVFTTETLTPEAAVHSRFFAPAFGIPEDPATGSVHGSLAVYLRECGLLQERGRVATGIAEQGDELNRPGRLHLEVTAAGGEIMRVRVGGRAAMVLRGRIAVPHVQVE